MDSRLTDILNNGITSNQILEKINKNFDDDLNEVTNLYDMLHQDRRNFMLTASIKRKT